MVNPNALMRFLNGAGPVLGIIASVFAIASQVRKGFDLQDVALYVLCVLLLFSLYVLSYKVEKSIRRNVVLCVVAIGFGCVIYFAGRSSLSSSRVLYDSIDQVPPRHALALDKELTSKFSLEKSQIAALGHLLRQSGFEASGGSYAQIKLVDKDGQFLGILELSVSGHETGNLPDGTPYCGWVDLSFLVATAKELKESYEGKYGGAGSEVDVALERLETAPAIVTQERTVERIDSISRDGFYIDWYSGRRCEAKATLIKNIESYDVGSKVSIDMKDPYALPIVIELSVRENDKREGGILSKYVFTRPLVYRLKIICSN